jgi:hypothetical protein
VEPITIATAFASIIGLIRVYKAETQEPDGRDFNRYIDWLRRQEHNQLADLISGNTDLSRSVRDLIEDQHREVMAKLASLDKILASVARHIDTFQPLADAFRGSQLSDQAVSVLRQLNEASESEFMEIKYCGGTDYEMGTSGAIQVSEPRFISDDLLTLCELGLLRLEQNGQGDRNFVITRAGAAVGGAAS